MYTTPACPHQSNTLFIIKIHNFFSQQSVYKDKFFMGYFKIVLYFFIGNYRKLFPFVVLLFLLTFGYVRQVATFF